MEDVWRVTAIQQSPLDGRFFVELWKESEVSKFDKTRSPSTRWDTRENMLGYYNPSGIDSVIRLEVNPLSFSYKVGDLLQLNLEYVKGPHLARGQTRLTEP